ncbi:MAG TPA: hypothetical protein VHC69_10935 [Polyangiaceae bacterium]|nr:hypothetical protein [Polyangiaceae bacterium]
MKQPFLCSILFLAVGCSSGTNSGGEPVGAAGTAGASGSAGSNQSGASGTSASGGHVGSGGTAANGGNSANGGASANGGGGTGTAGSANGGSANGGSGNGGSGNGGAGNGGTAGAGTGGASGAGGALDTSQSVLERNKHPNRDGFFIQPALTTAAAAKMSRDAGFAPKFSNQMWASPLYLEQGPNGKGVFFAVTTGNDVLALDETTGATVWTKNIGTPASTTGVPCGDIHPLGILSTPVIDAASRTIYVAGAVGGATGITSHQVHAYSVDDGTEKAGFPVTIKGTSGSTTFTPAPQNQRGALSLVNGTLYVAFGGHVGDCGPYHGWVVGIDTTDPTKMGGWATLGQGEGIWAPGGMASDGNGVFAVTGNSTVGVGDHMMSDSEEVVRITGLGVLDRSNQNLFFSSNWHTMDAGDQDLGSASPVYISVPGATPANFVVAVTKDGHMFLLDPANLGGMGGSKVDFMVANGVNSVHTALGSYTTTKGRYVMLGTDANAACPAGGASGKVVMAVQIPAGNPPKPAVAWCAPQAGAVPGPIATSTDGTTNVIVWYMSGNTLMGVDGDTGKTVYSGSGADGCSGVEQWTSLIAAKGRIVSASNGTLCSWSSK